MTLLYVSPTGSNTASGTLDKPFASLQHAHGVAKPGDTIYMRGGVYKLTATVRLTRDGTQGNPITITNYQNEVPILDGSLVPATSWVIDMNSASWWHIKGLEITKGPEGGLIVQGASHNNVIERLNIHHNGWKSQWQGMGFLMFGACSNNLLLNNDSHHNQDINLANADGFAIGSVTGANNVLRGNRAWANSDDGFDFFNAQNGTQNGTWLVEGNWAFGNGYTLSGGPGGDGYGFKLGGRRAGTTGSSGGHTVRNNAAWANRSLGFGGEPTTPLILENNTASDNSLYNYGFWNTVAHTVRKNIAFGAGKIDVSGTVTGNSWHAPFVVSAADFASLDDSTARGARAADGSLPTTQFLHPTNGSDLSGLGAFEAAANPHEAKLRAFADQIKAGKLKPATGSIYTPADGSVIILP